MSLLDVYIIYFVALLPAAVIITYVYKKDLFPEDKREVAITFLLGSSIVLFLYLMIPIAESFNDVFFEGYGHIAFLTFFRAATLEETFKLLVVFFYSYKLKSFNEPMDAVVFATSASLGFAAIENIQYVHLGETENQAFDIAFARAFSAVPLHGLCGIIMGIFFGLAAFAERNNKKYLFYALAIPIVIHGTYNFVLSIGAGILIYLILIVLIFRINSIFEKLNYDQIKRGKEDLELTYEITLAEILSNILKITGIIIVGVITLEVFFN
tara:strand:+ start:572 stop:1375 length:804 start_codon:yes stop_codon:yes gene_type:complete